MNHSVASRADLLAALAIIQSHPGRHHVIDVMAENLSAQDTLLHLLPGQGISVTINGPGRITDTSLHKTGDGDVHLNSAAGYTRVQLEDGRMSVAHDEALGTTGVTVLGGHLRGARDLTLRNWMHFAGTGTSRVSAATDTTLTFRSPLIVDHGHNLHFGSEEDRGTVVLDTLLPANVPIANIAIDGGTLKLGNAWAGQFLAHSRISIQSTALFDMNGFSGAISGVAGLGTITNSGDNPADLTVYGTSSFAGRMTGNIALRVQNGTLTLSGDNAHTGGTAIVEGRLIARHFNALGTGPLALMYGGTLQSDVDLHLAHDVHLDSGRIDTNGRDITIDGVISGEKLQKDGAGTLTLNGENTFSGFFIQTGGTVVLGHESALGTSAVSVAGSGTALLANRSMTITNPISWADGGTSCIAAADGAVLRLTGLKSYGTNTTFVLGTEGYGGTVELAHNDAIAQARTMFVSAGTLRYGSQQAGTSTARTTMLLDRGTTLDLNGFNSFLQSLSGYGTIRNDHLARSDLRVEQSGNFGGSITGNTSLTLGPDADRLFLWGVNTYTGPTEILGGTLSVAGGQALPDTTDIRMSGHTLEILDSEVAHSLSNLSATDRATVSTAAGATLTIRELNGVGSFDKVGGGALALTGAGDHTGELHVREGALALNSASSESQVTLHGGTTLIGSGRIGQLQALEGARVDLGPSLATLSVSGDIHFSTGTIYEIGVDGSGGTDLIDGQGRAVLAGGLVHVRAAPGLYKPANTYTILKAAGGRSGAFAGASTDFAFLAPELHYHSDSVELTLLRNDFSFDSAGKTPNQAAAGHAADRLPFDHPVHNAILGLTLPEVPHAFDQISGEAHASIMSSLLEDSRLIRDAALDRLREPFEGAPALSPDQTGSTDKSGKVSPRRSLLNPHRTTVWGQAIGGFAQSRSDGNAASVSRQTGGYVAGIETLVGDRAKIGIALGYSQTSFSGARSSSAQINSYHAALYAGFDLGSGWMVRVGAAYTHHDINLDRNVAFSGFRDRLSANYTASTAQVFGELSYRSTFSWGTVEPFLQVAAVRVSTDRFVENGGPAALTGSSRSQDAVFTTLGVRFAAQPFADLPLTIRGMIGWRHAFGDLRPDAHLAFRGTLRDFSVRGVPLAKDSLVAELALEYKINKRTTVGVSYSAAISARQQDHTVKAYLSIAF